MAYEGPERRTHMAFTEEQLDEIAERAAQKALKSVYEEVGRAVLRRLAFLAGAAVLALVVYLSAKGVKVT